MCGTKISKHANNNKGDIIITQEAQQTTPLYPLHAWQKEDINEKVFFFLENIK